MKGIINRGYLTRFDGREKWEGELIEATAEECIEVGDVCPFYLQDDNGEFYEFYEFYEWTPPKGKTLYKEK